MTLTGQTILVTGATAAIGQAICRSLLADGARVEIRHGRKRAAAETLLDEVGGQGSCLSAHLSRPEGAAALWDAAVAAVGRITGRVNTAGTRSEVAVDAPLPEWQGAWDRERRVNLPAAVDLTRAGILHFRQNGGGRIVNMASRAGQRGYSATALASGASEAALITLTESVAQSCGAEGITAVAPASGWVRTEMAEAFIAQHGEAAAPAGIPKGRMAAPEEVGERVAFMLRPSQVSLSGAVLDVNGGSRLRQERNMRLQDKGVVVKGAAGGSGTAIAQRFAAEDARLVVTDVNADRVEATAAAIRVTGGRARGIASDISGAEGCKTVIADAWPARAA